MKILSSKWIWVYSFFISFGVFVSFPIFPDALFTEIQVSSDQPLMAWRLSTNANFLPLDPKVNKPNAYKTTSPAKLIFVGIPDQLETGNIILKMSEKDQFNFSYKEIRHGWKVVTDYNAVMNRSDLTMYVAPSLVHTSTSLFKIIPIMNWFTIDVELWFFLIPLFGAILLFLIWKKGLNGDLMQRLVLINHMAYLPPVLGFIFATTLLFRYGVDFYWMDSLAFLNLVELKEKMGIGLSDLWAQHNEHRIVLVRLSYLFLALFKPFNILLLSELNQLMIFTTSILLVFMSKMAKPEHRLSLSLGMTYILVSPVNMENILLPFHGQWHAFVFGAALTFFAADRLQKFIKSPIFWLGIFVCYFSMPSWVCLPMSLLTGDFLEHFSKDGKKITRTSLLHFFLFGCITLVLFAVYMKNWVSIGENPIDGFFTNPQRFAIFFFQLLGNQLPQPQLAMVSGLIIFSSYLFLLYKKIKGEFIFPRFFLYFSLFSITWSLITAVGRSSTGTATASRYAFISLALWVSVLAVTILNWEKLLEITKKLFILGMLLVFCVQAHFGFSFGRKSHEIIQNDLVLMQKVLKENNPDDLKESNINPFLYLDQKPAHRERLLAQFKLLIDRGYWKVP